MAVWPQSHSRSLCDACTACILAGGGASSVDPSNDQSLPPSLQENLKMLKRLGYPDAEHVEKNANLVPKITTSLTKRLNKLDELKQEMTNAKCNSAIFAKNLICIYVFRTVVHQRLQSHHIYSHDP